MQWCRRSWEDKLKCVKILSVKDHNSAKICRTWIISPHALPNLWCNIPAKFHSNPCTLLEELRRQAKICKNSKCQGPYLPNMNYLPTCTSKLVVQHLYQVSFKSMQGCRRSWEDKLWCEGRTEWRKDRMTEWRTKQTLNAPLPFYRVGIKILVSTERSCRRE